MSTYVPANSGCVVHAFHARQVARTSMYEPMRKPTIPRPVNTSRKPLCSELISSKYMLPICEITILPPTPPPTPSNGFASNCRTAAVHTTVRPLSVTKPELACFPWSRLTISVENRPAPSTTPNTARMPINFDCLNTTISVEIKRIPNEVRLAETLNRANANIIWPNATLPGNLRTCHSATTTRINALATYPSPLPERNGACAVVLLISPGLG